VGLKELADLRAREAFRTVSRSLQVKEFWVTREDAEWFARRLERLGEGPTEIVEVRVASEDLARIPAIDVDSRSARSVEEVDLTWFNGCIVELVLPSSESGDG
jgi:hypothetical protein